MNVVRENLENQSALLKVTVAPEDYTETVNNALKNYKKKANMPGFRPGMVPMGIINKMYRKGVTAEETYKAASNAAYKFIEENNIEILGDVIPSENQPELDFENGTDFQFDFQIGLAPEVDLKLTKKDKIKKYTISVDEQMREGYRNNVLRRFGKLVDVETVSSDEAITGTLSQEDNTIEEAYVGLISMSEQERAPFIGKKVGDTLQVNVNELYKSASQRASILGVNQEELDQVNPEFTLKIDRIRRFENPPLDEEFFQQAYPEGQVTTPEQFEADIEAKIASDLEKETDYKLIDDVRQYMVEKANLTLPEDFLKRWLYVINEGKFTMEAIEKDFPQFADMMKWDLVKKFYVKNNQIEVTEDEIRTEAKALAMMQFAYYGMTSVTDEMLDNYAGSILGNRDEVRKIYDRLYERKVVDVIAGQVTLVPETVTSEEFRKFIPAQQ